MVKRKTLNSRLGSTLDSFLEEEGILEDATAQAQNKVLAYQLAKEMQLQKISKSEMARRLRTSRSQIDKLLNPNYNKFQIDTAQKFAAALGKTLRIELI